MNSLAAGAKSKKLSFGGKGQNSSSRSSTSAVSFKFGTVGDDDGIPSYATKNPANDFPELSNARKAPVSALQTVTASLDGVQLGKGSKLGSKASPVPVEGTSAIVQNTNSQVTPKHPPQHWQRGSGPPLVGPGEANKDSGPAIPSPSPSIDDTQFPTLSDASSVRNRGPSRQRRGRGRVEQVQTHVPVEPQQLKQAGDGRDGRQNRPGRDPVWETAECINALGRTL